MHYPFRLHSRRAGIWQRCKTGLNKEHTHTIECSLKLDSNPEFTSSALIAFARAIDRKAKRGETGCRTVFDVAPADLSPLSGDELRAHML